MREVRAAAPSGRARRARRGASRNFLADGAQNKFDETRLDSSRLGYLREKLAHALALALALALVASPPQFLRFHIAIATSPPAIFPGRMTTLPSPSALSNTPASISISISISLPPPGSPVRRPKNAPSEPAALATRVHSGHPRPSSPRLASSPSSSQEGFGQPGGGSADHPQSRAFAGILASNPRGTPDHAAKAHALSPPTRRGAKSPRAPPRRR